MMIERCTNKHSSKARYLIFTFWLKKMPG